PRLFGVCGHRALRLRSEGRAPPLQAEKLCGSAIITFNSPINFRSGKSRSHQRIATFAPGIQTTLQGADAFDAFFSEEQRHTGAGGFVGSSTVEDDFAVERQ